MKIQQNDALGTVSIKVLTCIKYLLIGTSMHSTAIQLFLDPSLTSHTEEDLKNAKNQVAEIYMSLNTEIKAGLENSKEYMRNKPGYGAIDQITQYSDLAAFGAAKRFAKLIKAKKFHLAYFFCFTLYSQLKNDPVYLGVFLKNVNQINKSCCPEFSIYLLLLLSTKDVSGQPVLPENHDIKEPANLNGVLIWLLQDKYFTHQLVKLVENPATFLSHDALHYLIKTFEMLSAAKKIQTALPNFSNNPYADAAYLCHLVNHSKPIQDYLNRPTRIDLLRSTITLDRLIEVKAHIPSVLFAWHYPDAMQYTPKKNLLFNKWLIRTDQALPLMHVGFVRYELGIRKLLESLSSSFVKNGLILLDILHGQERARLSKLDWQERILESKNPAKIIEGYSAALIGLTDLSFIREMLIVDVQTLLQQIAQFYPKLIEENQLTELKLNKINILIDNINLIIPKLKAENQQLADTVTLDLDNIKLICDLIDKFNQLNEFEKLKKYREEKNSQDISGISRAVEAEAWVMSWLTNPKAQKTMRKDSNLLHEIYLLLAFIHQCLNLIPHHDSELEVKDKSLLKLSNSLEMAIEFFKTLNLSQQTFLLKILMIRTSQQNSKLSQKIQSNFYLVANLLVTLPVSADKSEILKEIPIDKHDEFLYYFNLTPNSSSIRSDIIKTLDLYADDASSAEPGIFFQKIKRLEKEKRNLLNQTINKNYIDFSKAFTIVTQYNHSKIPHQELADKLLKPALNEEIIFTTTKLVMALKFPLSLKYLLKPTIESEDKVVDQFDEAICKKLISFGKIKHETDRQNIEDIRAHVLMMLVDPFLSKETYNLFKAAQIILLSDTDHLSGTIMAFVKNLLNQSFSACNKSFIKFEFFFKKNLLSTGIFEKKLHEDKNLKLVTTVIHRIYGLLEIKSSSSIKLFHQKDDCQALVNYTLLTICPIGRYINVSRNFLGTQIEFKRAVKIFTELAIYVQKGSNAIQVKDFYDLLAKNPSYDWEILLAVLILDLPKQACDLIKKLQNQKKSEIKLHYEAFIYCFTNPISFLVNMFVSLQHILDFLIKEHTKDSIIRALACETLIIEAEITQGYSLYFEQIFDCLLYNQASRERLAQVFDNKNDDSIREKKREQTHYYFINSFIKKFGKAKKYIQLSIIKACAQYLQDAAEEEKSIITKSKDIRLENFKKYILAIYQIHAICLLIFSWQAAQELSLYSWRTCRLKEILKFPDLSNMNDTLYNVKNTFIPKLPYGRSILMIRIASYYSDTQFDPIHSKSISSTVLDEKITLKTDFSYENNKEFVPAFIISQCLLEERIDLISMLVQTNVPLVTQDYKIFRLVSLLLDSKSKIPPINRILADDNDIRLISQFLFLLLQYKLPEDNSLKKKESNQDLPNDNISLTDYTSGAILAIVKGCIESKQASLVKVIIPKFGSALNVNYNLPAELKSDEKLIACTRNIVKILNEFKDDYDYKEWIDLFLKNIPNQILDRINFSRLPSTISPLSKQSPKQRKNQYELPSIFTQGRAAESTSSSPQISHLSLQRTLGTSESD